MGTKTIENTDKYIVQIDEKSGDLYLTDKKNAYSAVLINEDIDDFTDKLKRLKVEYYNPESPWHSATWNDCIAFAADPFFAKHDKEYKAWRTAAHKLGWRVIESVPESKDIAPCIYNPNNGQALPVCAWEEGVREMGFSDPSEAMSRERVEM